MKKIVSIGLVVFFFSVAPLVADYYIQQKLHTGAFEIMGQSQPAKDETIHLWLGDNMMAMISNETSSIINNKDQLMYMINHADKTYVEMELPLDMSKYLPPELQQMMGNIAVTVTPTGETQTINSWNCSGYDVNMKIMMMDMNMKYWASTEVPFDWKTYSENMYSQMTQATMQLSPESLDEFKKIEGWQIKTEMSMDMMGAQITTTTEVVEISEKTPPEGTFTVPDGYTKKEKFTMQDMQKR
ncbi:MAG: DUF4412 domain-containing protein [Candidatus Aminicenantes bacterium]|nr:DUF4412 domain-containing protein [Candidatus Aminicenantes bacterium]